jgi:hypothetical protein
MMQEHGHEPSLSTEYHGIQDIRERPPGVDNRIFISTFGIGRLSISPVGFRLGIHSLAMDRETPPFFRGYSGIVGG